MERGTVLGVRLWSSVIVRRPFRACFVVFVGRPATLPRLTSRVRISSPAPPNPKSSCSISTRFQAFPEAGSNRRPASLVSDRGRTSRGGLRPVPRPVPRRFCTHPSSSSASFSEAHWDRPSSSDGLGWARARWTCSYVLPPCAGWPARSRAAWMRDGRRRARATLTLFTTLVRHLRLPPLTPRRAGPLTRAGCAASTRSSRGPACAG